MLDNNKVEQFNQVCQKCIEDFEKESIPFRPSMCKYCKNGSELHKELLRTQLGEKKWGDVDWNSARFRDD